MNLTKNLNKKQIAKIDEVNKKVAFFNAQKVETSTKSSRWNPTTRKNGSFMGRKSVSDEEWDSKQE
jgi:hypothetical protein